MLITTHLYGFGSRVSRTNALTFVTSATSTSASVTIPVSAATGDVAFLFDYSWETDGNQVFEVVPSGWTKIDGAAVTSPEAARGTLFYRVLEAGDPGAHVSGMNNEGEDKVMLVFRPERAVSTVAAAGTNIQATKDNPASQVIAAGSGTAYVAIAVAAAREGDPSYTTESPAFTATVTADAAKASYKIYNESGAAHTVDIGDSGYTNFLASLRLEVT